jgi:hypothetical protein
MINGDAKKKDSKGNYRQNLNHFNKNSTRVGILSPEVTKYIPGLESREKLAFCYLVCDPRHFVATIT